MTDVEAGKSQEALVIELRQRRGKNRAPVALSPASCLRIGSASTNDCVVEGPGVLAEHAVLEYDGRDIWIRPVDGAGIKVNGQAVNERATVDDGDWLVLGLSPFVVSLRGKQPDASPAARVTPHQAEGVTLAKELTVGRVPENDIRIDSPVVSRLHARLQLEPHGCWIEDLDSTNGTFANEARVVGRVLLAPGARVQFASFSYIFDGATLRPTEGTGRIRLVARGLAKVVRDSTTRGPKTLLSDIDLAVEAGEFVTIFGTSGSGKSTLLDALSGRRPASTGTVRYNDFDLYRHFDILRTAVGYVPQQDIVHRKITVQRALAHTARLRLPEDTSETEIADHVARVLDRVGLADKADQAIETPAPLSGGQLKRVSLAVELISNPAILFLDEATSGLDAATDKRMMRLFAELSADGKTVVCVTHTLENIEACDLVVLMHRGRVAYVGPPEEALDHFGVTRLTEVYEVIESAPIEEWADRFLASKAYDAYVGRRLETSQDESAPRSTRAQPEALRSKRRSAVRQTKTLTRRYLDLILSDRRNLAILLLQAPLIGLVIGSVFNTSGSPSEQAVAQTQVHVSFMLVISAIWFGCLNSAREVVKELPIFLRERAVNLEVAPYLLSKLGPLALICVIQVVGLVVATSALVELSGSNAARTGVLCLAALAATAMGLTVSALVNSSDKAVAAVPMLLIPQVILSNAIVQLEGGSKLVAKASIVSFWAFDAMKALMDPEIRAPGDIGTSLVLVETDLWTDVTAMGLLLAAFLASALLALRLKDRRR